MTTPQVQVGLTLILIYVVLSIICTGLSGAIADLLLVRSRALRRFVSEFLDGGRTLESLEPGRTGASYAHPLIQALSAPRTRRGRRRSLPESIPAPVFTLAVLDLLREPPCEEPGKEGSLQEDDPVARGMDRLEREDPLRRVIEPLYVLVADHDWHRVPLALSEVVEYGMRVVDEQIRRDARRLSFLLALMIAVALNLDSIEIARTVWRQASEGHAPAALPLGWKSNSVGFDPLSYVSSIAGCALTAGAASFGAEFWLGLLERLSSVPLGDKPDAEARNRRNDRSK